MIFLRWFANGVIFNKNESLSIYASCDDYGRDELVFESPSTKVVFSIVSSCYEWTQEILNHIKQHILDDAIVIDLDMLIQDGDSYKEMEYEINTIDFK